MAFRILVLWMACAMACGGDPASGNTATDAGTPDGPDGPNDPNSPACSVWHGIGGSEFGSACERMVWGSNSGAGISGNDLTSWAPTMAIDASGYPVIAWGEGIVVGAEDILLRRWNGTNWVAIGSSATRGVISPARRARFPSLALDGSGNPMIGWAESSADALSSYAYVRRWNGANWVELAGSASGTGLNVTTGSAGGISVAFDRDGNPLVAWHEVHDGRADVYFRRWDGTTWAMLGASATINDVAIVSTGATAPRIAIDGSNNPIVAYQQTLPGNLAIYVRRWNGSTWAELAGSASGNGLSTSGRGVGPILTIDNVGQPIVGFLETDQTATPQIHVARWNGTAWLGFGGSAGSGGISQATPGDALTFAALVVDPSGAPIAVWSNRPASDPANRTYRVTAWNGSSWQDVGAGTTDYLSAVGVGLDGRPIITSYGYHEHPLSAFTNNQEVYVRRWDGNAWAEYLGPAMGGGISNTSGGSETSTIAMDAMGRPTVAWLELQAGSFGVYLRTWDGTLWNELGGSATGNGIGVTAMEPALAIDGASNPMLAWTGSILTGIGGYNVFFRRWDGAAWVEFGGSGSGGGVSNHAPGGGVRGPVVAIDGSDTPIIAWSDWTAMPERIMLRRWSGSAWIELGGSASGYGVSGLNAIGDNAVNPSLAVDAAGNPIVSWVTMGAGDVRVRRWNGVSWNDLGGAQVATGAGDVAMVLDGNGDPVVAWRKQYTAEIHVVRWNGSTWVDLGTMGQSGAQTSLSIEPTISLAVDGTGNPIVTWEDASSGNHEVYVRRWDGAIFAEVVGSGSGGGLSNSAEHSLLPRIGFGGDRTCVTWQERGVSDQTEIVMRCADQP